MATLEIESGSTTSSSSDFVDMSLLEKEQKDAIVEVGRGETTLETVETPPAFTNRPPTAATVVLPVPTRAPSSLQVEQEESVQSASSGKTTVLSFLPQNQAHAVRMAMTLLLGLLVTGVLCTFLMVPQYALLLSLFWMLLISLFAGLVWFVQTAVLQNRTSVFHPYVHKFGAAVMSEYHAFYDDWRQEVLMLTNQDVADDLEGSSGKSASSYAPQQPSKKGESRLFRLAVKPFLPLMARRRQRKKAAQQVANSEYVPPAMDPVR
jgi:hypothetical protein